VEEAAVLIPTVNTQTLEAAGSPGCKLYTSLDAISNILLQKKVRQFVLPGNWSLCNFMVVTVIYVMSAWVVASSEKLYCTKYVSNCNFIHGFKLLRICSCEYWCQFVCI